MSKKTIDRDDSNNDSDGNSDIQDDSDNDIDYKPDSELNSSETESVSSSDDEDSNRSNNLSVRNNNKKKSNDNEVNNNNNDNVNNNNNNEVDANSNQQQPQRRTTRKRRANPINWKKNKRKRLRNSGEEYVSTKGTTIRARAPQSLEKHSASCRFKCCQNITADNRQLLCDQYWQLADYVRQRDYLLSAIRSEETIRKKQRTTNRAPRSSSQQFFLEIDGTKYRVCRLFFEKTLDIGPKTVTNVLKHRSPAGTFDTSDGRGQHEPHNKTANETYEKVKRHISSFPVVESHYCRKQSSRKYLEAGLSIKKMYKLYVERCRENKDTDIVSDQIYRQILCDNYNIGFHKPRKDQCTTCTQYDNADDERKAQLKENYDRHFRLKDLCQNAKESSKQKAKADKTILNATFDLQSVLQLPCSEASPMYYKRKICVYNFTIFEGATKNGICYLWNELEGGRGSAEIGSILIDFVSKANEKQYREIEFFSDSCGGQNRNQNVAAAMLYCVRVFDNIHQISLNYLEPGHTQMECDSMHSAIENAKEYAKVYSMDQWENIMKLARSGKPYDVERLKFNSFSDIKQLCTEVIKNSTKNSTGEKVSWLKIKILRFQKASPQKIFYSYEPGEVNQWLEIPVKPQGRPAIPELKPLYTALNPISDLKHKDLMSLCLSGVIPEIYHHWYQQLPKSKRKKDVNVVNVDSQDSDSE